MKPARFHSGQAFPIKGQIRNRLGFWQQTFWSAAKGAAFGIRALLKKRGQNFTHYCLHTESHSADNG
jgi:hypothetical protein